MLGITVNAISSKDVDWLQELNWKTEIDLIALFVVFELIIIQTKPKIYKELQILLTIMLN